MPFVPAPNIMMGEVRATLAGQLIENRFHFNKLGTVTPTDLETLSVALWNWAELSYFPQLPATVHLNEVVCTDLTTIDGAQATYAPDTTTNGSIAGDVLPNECSMCISLRTGNRGRSARGRFYTFAVPQANMADDNFITPTYSSALATVGNDLVAAFQETTPLTIVSYRSGGVPRPGGPVYFLVSNALLVDNLVDSMRRRKPGVGT